MKLITDSKELRSTFETLCSSYAHYKWAVAWAGNPHAFDLAKVLTKNSRKIERLVVGLHFYQTSPEFIERFMEHPNVKFFMQTDGTFHTKMYIFYNDEYDWQAIVGSSNFTNAAFHDNFEANILISNNDGGVTFNQLTDYVETVYVNADTFDNSKLESYKELCLLQTKKHASLKKLNLSNKEKMSSPMDVMTWDEYFTKITSCDMFSINDRLQLLNKASEIFKEDKPFDSLHSEIKKALAGFLEYTSVLDDCDCDWRLFGSMKGAGIYKHAINANVKIGKALDLIPHAGTVTKGQFDKYCEAFDGWKNPLGCATRLLAIKRPDFFVCINTKNKQELSKLLKLPQSAFTLDNYWDEILMRIHDAVWFKEELSAASEMERDIKRFQVAMLDSISYINRG